MCPRDCKHAPAEQRIFSEPLRAGSVAVAPIQYGLHERVAPAHDIPDHPYIRIQAHLIGTIPYGQFDALRFKLRAHRRIDIGVASGDAVARSLGNHGDAAHESAADAKYVDVHGQTGTPGQIEGRAAEKREQF